MLSMQTLFVVALIVPVAVVAVALVLNWLLVRSIDMKRRNHLRLFLGLAFLNLALGLNAIACGESRQALPFVFAGVGWLIYVLVQRRVWRRVLDDPAMHPDGTDQP
jgi:hypothetical protein